jgi:hypothetical protein
MIRVDDTRETARSHMAADCEPGTTLVGPGGDLWLCVKSDDTREHIWVHIDPARGGRAILCDVDKPREAHGKLCNLEIKVLEK